MRRCEIQSVQKQAVDSWVKLGGALLAVAVSNPPQDIANELLDKTAKPALVNTLALAVVSILCA
jgi:hypothetical protein